MLRLARGILWVHQNASDFVPRWAVNRGWWTNSVTNEDFFAQLQGAEGVVIADGAEVEVLQKVATHVKLPMAHVALLTIANGVSVFGGCFRLFGCSSSTMIDMTEWNSPELWTFAWNKRLESLWFFGETAWGDQYAYQRDELQQSDRPRVFFADGLTMKAEVIADDFSAFLECEFLRNALQPYDEHLVAARERLGDLEPFEHIVYVPSPLIAGGEDVDSVTKLDAVASMIINGDLCNQLAEQTQDRPIKELQPYEDAKGRMRIRVIWS